MNASKSVKKGFGLLEVLVALVVFGTTMIVALALTVRSLKIIKENEQADLAAAFMVSSLEYAKAPIAVPANLPVGTYRVNLVNDQIVELIRESSILDETTDCDSSAYQLDIDTDQADFIFCNMIIVENINPIDPNSNRLITSRIVYNHTDTTVMRELKSFRLFPVEEENAPVP